MTKLIGFGRVAAGRGRGDANALVDELLMDV